MKLNIPHCKQKMTLLSDCTVRVSASRYVNGNVNLLLQLGLLFREDKYGRLECAETGKPIWGDRHADKPPSYDVTFPKGTVFTITQMYIRNGGWNEDCINMRIVGKEHKIFKSTLGVLTFDLEATQDFDVELHEGDN